MHGQHGQIGVVAGEHDLVHRSPCGRHFDRSDGMRQALAQNRRKADLIGIERGGKAPSAPHHVAYELGLLRPDRAKPDRMRVTVEHRGHVDEIDRLVMDDAFALLHQPLDEIAQAKFVGVDGGHADGFELGRCSARSRS